MINTLILLLNKFYLPINCSFIYSQVAGSDFVYLFMFFKMCLQQQKFC